MDITLLVSFLGFAALVASWIMLPTGVSQTSSAAAPVASASKA